MPRYLYRCTSCKELTTLFHLSDETAHDCPKCDSSESLVKSLTAFTTSRKGTPTRRVGDTTEEFIQDARHDLRKHKKDLEDKR